MSTERHRALRLLAGSPLGVTEAIMLAHCFTSELMDGSASDGLRRSLSPKPKLTDAERHKRFVEMAREVEAFDRVLLTRL